MEAKLNTRYQGIKLLLHHLQLIRQIIRAAMPGFSNWEIVSDNKYYYEEIIMHQTRWKMDENGG